MFSLLARCHGECASQKNTPVPIAEVICGKPGTALMFHQGVYHCGTKNDRDYPRYIQHVVYAPPWLIPSDRKRNNRYGRHLLLRDRRQR